MGLGTKGGLLYLQGHNGFIFLASDKERTDKNDQVSGYVSKVSYRDNEFTHEGKTIKKRLLSVNIKDGEEVFNLQIDVKSRGYATFAGQLLNVDLGKVVEINSKARELPTKDAEGKPKFATDFYITQGGGVTSAFSKASGSIELPAWKEVIFEGEKRYDRKEYYDKIEEIITEKIISQMPDEQGNDVNHSSYEDSQDKADSDDTQDDGNEEEDDSQELPF